MRFSWSIKAEEEQEEQEQEGKGEGERKTKVERLKLWSLKQLQTRMGMICAKTCMLFLNNKARPIWFNRTSLVHVQFARLNWTYTYTYMYLHMWV